MAAATGPAGYRMRQPDRYSRRMDLDVVLAAKPWTYWISPLLTLVTVLAILGVIVGYVFKVVAAKYPKT